MKNESYSLLGVVALCFVCTANSALALYWDPLDTGGNLIGWYDASDSETVITNTAATQNVLEWQDKSANGYHMNIAPTKPTYGTAYTINGLKVLWFDQTNGELYRNNIPNIDCSRVCVVSVGEAKTAGDYPNLGSIYSTDLSDKLALRLNCTTTSGSLSNTLKLDGVSKNLATGSSTNLAEEIPFMLAVWYDGSNGVARTDGGSVSYTDSSVADGATFTINEIQCGRDSNTPKNYHGEMVVLKDQTVDMIEKVEGYLAHKWGIWTKFPTNHPYRYHEPDAPIPFGPLSSSNITSTAADLYAVVETNLTSATVVWDTADKGTTNITDWTGTRSITVDSTPGQITGTATGLTEDTWYYSLFIKTDVTYTRPKWDPSLPVSHLQEAVDKGGICHIRGWIARSLARSFGIPALRVEQGSGDN